MAAGHGANSGGNPGILHAKGEDWVLDGDRWVPKRLVDQYGSADDIPWSSPQERMESSMERSEGTNTQYREQAAQQQGDASGQDGDYAYHNSIGAEESKYRTNLSNSLGTNRKSDSSPKGVLADELYFGHMDALPGQNGVYFNAKADGTYVFKDSNGNVIPPNDALMQAAAAGVKQGYGTGAVHSGNGAGGTPSLPNAPTTTTGSTIIPPNTNPVYSDPKAGAAANSRTPPVSQPSPTTRTGPAPVSAPPQQNLNMLTVSGGQPQGGSASSLPEAPASFNTVPQPVKAAPATNVPNYMGNFFPGQNTNKGMQLPKAPQIGNSSSNIGKGIGDFKIGG